MLIGSTVGMSKSQTVKVNEPLALESILKFMIPCSALECPTIHKS